MDAETIVGFALTGLGVLVAYLASLRPVRHAGRLARAAQQQEAYKAMLDSLVDLDEKLHQFKGKHLTSKGLDDLNLRDELVIIKKSVVSSAGFLMGSRTEKLTNKLDIAIDTLLSSGVPDSDEFKAANDGGHEALHACLNRTSSLGMQQQTAVLGVRELCDELRRVLQDSPQASRSNPH